MNYGTLLQAATVIGATVAVIFKAGVWVSDIRADLKAETETRQMVQKEIVDRLRQIEEDNRRVMIWQNIPQSLPTPLPDNRGR